MRKNVELDLFINLCREILEKAWPIVSDFSGFFPSFLMPDGPYDFIQVSFFDPFLLAGLLDSKARSGCCSFRPLAWWELVPAFTDSREPWQKLMDLWIRSCLAYIGIYWHISCRIHCRYMVPWSRVASPPPPMVWVQNLRFGYIFMEPAKKHMVFYNVLTSSASETVVFCSVLSYYIGNYYSYSTTTTTTTTTRGETLETMTHPQGGGDRATLHHICDFFDSPQTKAMKKTEVRDILEGSLSGERRQASLGLGWLTSPWLVELENHHRRCMRSCCHWQLDLQARQTVAAGPCSEIYIPNHDEKIKMYTYIVKNFRIFQWFL